MKYPLPDLLDRISIVKLKRQRIGQETCIQQYKYLMKGVEDYDIKDPQQYIDRLYQFNGKIWDLQSDIRKGKQGQLGWEQVGKRAIAIRQLNKQRVSVRNEIVQLIGEGFKDVKMNHASE